MTTSIKFHFRPSACCGRKCGKLFIRIIKSRQSRQISRNYTLYADEWDAVKGKVIISSDEMDTDRNLRLTLINEAVKNDQKRLQEIIKQLSESGEFSASDVVERFTQLLNSNTVSGYAEIIANSLREQGRERTARAYRSAARSLMNYNSGKEILLSEINFAMMAGYENHLLNKGLKLNTVSFYLRNLRALYFRAVDEKIIPLQSANPFAGMHTGVYETRRRALDDSQLKALAKLDQMFSERTEHENEVCVLHKSTSLYDSLLYFMFCYHARGMSFVDMAHLKRENIGAEIITYRRRKTGGLLEVTITDPMRRILAHFAMRTQGSEFIFPVIDSRKVNVRRQYETGLKRQNRSLKHLARMAGITENLSTHAARHTWATLAKRMNVPVAVIGEALGHRDVKTTSIYLASFDRATMDELSVRLSEAAQAA